MIPIHSAQAVREAEEEFFAQNPGVDLMQVAADGVAEAALRMLGDNIPHSPVLVAVGPGNNGGDGLYAAARLATAGCRVSFWLTAGSGHEAGLAAARSAGCQELDTLAATQALADTYLVIDAVLGIGGRPGLPDVVATFAAEAEVLGIEVLAVDLPSGLGADLGTLPEQSFCATRTITFDVLKPCHVLQPAARRCGVVERHPIGLRVDAEPVALQAEPADIARLWPVPGPTSHKYSRGVVGIDTGSTRYPGAAVLGTIGALHAGTGMIRFVGPDIAAGLIRSQLPSVTQGEGGVQAWLLGSGWGQTEANRDRLAGRLASNTPAVIDADALLALPDAVPANSLLTPHAGEMSRMLGVKREQVETDPLWYGRQAAERWNAVVLLKGATQYVIEPDGRVRLAVPGPHWSAQAGSGDVLAGICASLLASGMSASDAALLGSSVQAMAAKRKRGPWPPDVVGREVAAVVAEFDPFW
ncbi:MULTISPECIES: bifunctional ADP-dependent NAD(P)H-hydrate dehydratase/NAD(P)H-hydrate epimerase [unclassified Luteococcus]|uniref:bifunctional ADP-dependent NAD(P)H-hydrate dehydratase/NAD(P)H-hydrate epimerase n=1 Tax=unclassified Luteococcus TaxID=2639923 RepID=UPI00313C1CD4